MYHLALGTFGIPIGLKRHSGKGDWEELNKKNKSFFIIKY